MNDKQRRDALKTISENPKWHEKIDNMTEEKIRAMFARLKDQDKV